MPRKPTPLPRSARRIALLALLPLALPAAARAGEHDHHHHHHHVAAPSSATISRSEARLTLPKVALKTQDGKAVVLPELIDDYIAMVKGVVERHYHDVTRYTASTFLRMKLGEAMEKHQIAPRLYENADEAQGKLGKA